MNGPVIEYNHLDNPLLYAGVLAKRVVAYALDLIAIGALTLIAWGMLLILGIFTLGALFPLIPLAGVVVALAYHGLTIGGPRSATPGMRILGVRVRTIDDRPPTLLQALLQTLLFYATMAGLTPAVLLIALFNARGRTLHEILSGTVTLRTG